MKIIKTDTKNDSKWASDIVTAKSKKFSSLSIESGRVFCPLSNGEISTTNCELCDFCSGFDFNIANNQESIKCAHKESKNVKKASPDEVNRLYVSEKANEKENIISPNDLKSIFARSTSKFDDVDESDIMNGNRVVSAKNINESDSDGTSNFVSKFSNSIFDSNVISNLEETYKDEETEKQDSIKQSQLEKENSMREWEDDEKKSLGDIGYEPKGTIMSIAHEASASNPDVSEYKFSIFDNADDRLNKIPEFTDGEKLKTQSKKRKEDISREKKEDDWESNHSNTISTSKMVKGFFDNMLGE